MSQMSIILVPCEGVAVGGSSPILLVKVVARSKPSSQARSKTCSQYSDLKMVIVLYVVLFSKSKGRWMVVSRIHKMLFDFENTTLQNTRDRLVFCDWDICREQASRICPREH